MNSSTFPGNTSSKNDCTRSSIIGATLTPDEVNKVVISGFLKSDSLTPYKHNAPRVLASGCAILGRLIIENRLKNLTLLRCKVALSQPLTNE